MRFITFSEFQEHTTPIFKNFKILKLQDIIEFNTSLFVLQGSITIKIKYVFTTNESVNPYNTRGGELLFIPQVNTTHYVVKSLRYNGRVICNDFF